MVDSETDLPQLLSTAGAAAATVRGNHGVLREALAPPFPPQIEETGRISALVSVVSVVSQFSKEAFANLNLTNLLNWSAKW